MTRIIRTTDLVPGIVAAAILAALVIGMRIPIALSLGIALIVYVVLRLGQTRILDLVGDGDPATMSASRAIREADQRLRTIAQISDPVGRLDKPEVSQQLSRIQRRMRQVLDVIEHDRNKQVAAVPFLEQWVRPIQTLIEQYVRLSSRGIRSAEQELSKIEREDFPLIEERLAGLYEELHKGDVLDLEVGSDTLSLNLREIDVI